MTEDEMVGWHHRLNGQEFEQASGVGDGQEGLVCCSPWAAKSQTRMSKQTELKPRNRKVFTGAELSVNGAKSQCSEMCKG